MNERIKKINQAQLKALRIGDTARAVELDKQIARVMSEQGFIAEPLKVGGQ